MLWNYAAMNSTLSIGMVIREHLPPPFTAFTIVLTKREWSVEKQSEVTDATVCSVA